MHNNTTERTFLQTLEREKKFFTYYWQENMFVPNPEDVELINVEPTPFPCFFRRYNNSTNEEAYITMYCEKSSNLEQGMLITFNNSQYLVMNAVTDENDIYIKASITKCNTFIKASNGVIIPVVADDVSNPLMDAGKVINTVDGWTKLMTEYNALSNGIALDSEIKILNGTYKIINNIAQNGFTKLYVSRTTSGGSDQYTINFNVQTDVQSGETIYVEPDIYINDIPYTGEYSVVYVADNDNIEITGNEFIFNYGGVTNVTATVTIGETVFNDTITFNISGEPKPEPTLTCLIETVEPTIIVGFSRTFTARFYENGELVQFDPNWVIDFLDNQNPSDFTMTYSGNDITIAVANVSEYINTYIDLKLSDLAQTCSYVLNIRLRDLF